MQQFLSKLFTRKNLSKILLKFFLIFKFIRDKIKYFTTDYDVVGLHFDCRS